MLIHNHDAGNNEDRRDEIADENSFREAFTVNKFREDFAEEYRKEEGGEEVRDFAHNRHHRDDWDDEESIFEE